MSHETLPAQGPVDVNVRPCAEPCQKCGSDDIYRRFIAKGGEVPHEGYDKCASKYGTGQCHSWTATRDHLHHHCRCCGFAWQGLPLKKSKAGAGALVLERGSARGKTELEDCAVAGETEMNCAKVMERNVFLEGQNIALRSIVSALLGEANHNPFCTIGHWVEHGPCAAMLVEFDRASKEAYAKVLTEVAAMVPNV